MTDLAITTLILVVLAAVAAVTASAFRAPRHRPSARDGSPHRCDLDRPHRQAIHHFASGALPPWR